MTSPVERRTVTNEEITEMWATMLKEIQQIRASNPIDAIAQRALIEYKEEQGVALVAVNNNLRRGKKRSARIGCIR